MTHAPLISATWSISYNSFLHLLTKHFTQPDSLPLNQALTKPKMQLQPEPQPYKFKFNPERILL